MKKLPLLLTLIFLSAVSYGQQTSILSDLWIKNNFKLRTIRVDSIRNDTLNATLGQTNALPSMAVIKQLLNKIKEGGLQLAFSTEFNVAGSYVSLNYTNFPTASGSVRGLLSSADWTTFNGKLGSVDTGNIASFYTKVRGLFTAGARISITNGLISTTARDSGQVKTQIDTLLAKFGTDHPLYVDQSASITGDSAHAISGRAVARMRDSLKSVIDSLATVVAANGLFTTGTVTDANYTAPTVPKLRTTLVANTANWNYVLPASPADNSEILIFNPYATGYTWTFTVKTVKDAANNTVTTIPNLTNIHLLWDIAASVYRIPN